jgi:hypothetical protein
MAQYRSGKAARYGVYCSLSPLDVRFNAADGDPLSGSSEHYRRVPTPLVALAGPVLGAAFVLTFPVVIIFALLVGLYHLCHRKWLRDRCPAARNPSARSLARGVKLRDDRPGLSG